MTNFGEMERQFAANTAKANRLNKEIVFAALADAGITKVAVGFDGETDSGQIEGISAFRDETPVPLPDTELLLLRVRYGNDKPYQEVMKLFEAIETLCYGYLEQEHSGWEINEGAFGVFTFHVAERSIALDFNKRFSHSNLTSHVF